MISFNSGVQEFFLKTKEENDGKVKLTIGFMSTTIFLISIFTLIQRLDLFLWIYFILTPLFFTLQTYKMEKQLKKLDGESFGRN